MIPKKITKNETYHHIKKWNLIMVIFFIKTKDFKNKNISFQQDGHAEGDLKNYSKNKSFW